ncbi:MAG TPA: hypothetical protein VGL06_01185 [Pseudonocardiaceae bacterium]
MRAIPIPLLVLAVLAAGCAGTATAAVSDNTPSAAARMVCAADAQREISLSLGETLRKPVSQAWSDHVYSCDYVYPAGILTLSVRELSSTTAAATYYTRAHGRSTGPVTISRLGQAAYADPDGSLTVRKDAMVLRVDVHALPSAFGQPALSRQEAGRRVAADIMNCWMGA